MVVVVVVVVLLEIVPGAKPACLLLSWMQLLDILNYKSIFMILPWAGL